MRLQYDEAKKQVRNLQEQLAEIEEKMVPGQPESDKDRLVFLSVMTWFVYFCIFETFKNKIF